MTDTTTHRTAHVDAVLERLATFANRPWDSVRQPDALPRPGPHRAAAERLRTLDSSPDPDAETGESDQRKDAAMPGPLDLDRSWWRRGRIGQAVARWMPERPESLTRQWHPDTPEAPARHRRIPVAVLVGLVVVGSVIAALLTLSTNPTPEPAPNLPVAAIASAPPSRAPDVIVDIAGKVVSPGLRTLADGSRVADALSAAGGVIPGTDLTALNLARRLVDGEQIHVGIPIPPAAVVNQSATQPGPLDLNTATLAQLDTLPGVGTVTAQRILDWRTSHGRFTKVDQLGDVDGIGPARFATLKPLVIVR